jgi:hypothetical protein
MNYIITDQNVVNTPVINLDQNTTVQNILDLKLSYPRQYVSSYKRQAIYF